MLAMADQHGRVWASVPGLANIARVSIEACELALEELQAPDKYSRTTAHEGRRIEPIDGGWRLLNHAKYRAIRDEESIKESKRRYINAKRAAERASTVENVEQCRTDVERCRANTEADTEAEAENIELSKDNLSSAMPTTVSAICKIPDCPHARLIELFSERLPELPRPKVELWAGTSARNMRARWRWLLTAKKPNGARYATDEESAVAWMDRFFCYVSQSDFLMGRVGSFQCSLQWLMNAQNFSKVLQGNYDNRAAA